MAIISGARLEGGSWTAEAAAPEGDTDVASPAAAAAIMAAAEKSAAAFDQSNESLHERAMREQAQHWHVAKEVPRTEVFINQELELAAAAPDAAGEDTFDEDTDDYTAESRT